MSSNPYDQVPVEDFDLIDNPQPRCPCLLLLDTSASMDGAPINELNAGLAQFAQELGKDSLLSKRVEASIITFGPVQTVHDFATADNFHPPILSAGGDTPIGQAILHGLEHIRARRRKYKEKSRTCFRPHIFMITDGAPTDDWKQAAREVHAGDNQEFVFFGVGVANADMQTLAQISPRTKTLDKLMFTELFQWVFQSMQAISRSSPGDKVPLPSTGDWDGTRS